MTTANEIKEEHDPSTILINNAGIGVSHTVLETSDAWLDKIFGVNVLSHFRLIREFLPGMLAQRKGHIFGVASMATFAATANLVDYCSTKATVLSLHQGELCSFHEVHALLICLCRLKSRAPSPLSQWSVYPH